MLSYYGLLAGCRALHTPKLIDSTTTGPLGWQRRSSPATAVVATQTCSNMSSSNSSSRYTAVLVVLLYHALSIHAQDSLLSGSQPIPAMFGPINNPASGSPASTMYTWPDSSTKNHHAAPHRQILQLSESDMILTAAVGVVEDALSMADTKTFPSSKTKLVFSRSIMGALDKRYMQKVAMLLPTWLCCYPKQESLQVVFHLQEAAQRSLSAKIPNFNKLWKNSVNASIEVARRVVYEPGTLGGVPACRVLSAACPSYDYTRQGPNDQLCPSHMCCCTDIAHMLALYVCSQRPGQVPPAPFNHSIARCLSTKHAGPQHSGG